MKQLNEQVSPSLRVFTVLQKNGVALEENKKEALSHFVELLLEWNKKINLLSRRDAPFVWEHHILHSLTPVFLFSFERIRTIIDAGTGGGLPGIPLAILLPGVEFYLIDSVAKKVEAVRTMVGELELENVQVLCSRVEKLSATTLGLKEIDGVVARALAPLRDVVRWTRPLLAAPISSVSAEKDVAQEHRRKITLDPGFLLLFKGGDLTKEIADMKRLTYPISVQGVPLNFPGSELLSSADKKILIVTFYKGVS
ncbi:MAG: 16S rRNA (guanine(527)-N(7))-methyltransferase RsmG [Bacteroidota bacterium]